MVLIYCYAKWDPENVELILGFMSAANHQRDEDVFDEFEADTFSKGMTAITRALKRYSVKSSLLNQDNDHWIYWLHGDIKLQFMKAKDIIRDIRNGY